jgi:hypothetical protein
MTIVGERGVRVAGARIVSMRWRVATRSPAL